MSWNGLLAFLGLADAIETPEQDNEQQGRGRIVRDETFTPGEVRIDGKNEVIYRDNRNAKAGQWVLYHRPNRGTFQKTTILDVLPGGLLLKRVDELDRAHNLLSSHLSTMATVNYPQIVATIGKQNEITRETVMVGDRKLPVTRVKIIGEYQPNLFYVSDALPFGCLVKDIIEDRKGSFVRLELVDFGDA